jgi:ankyrin repeat protein
LKKLVESLLGLTCSSLSVFLPTIKYTGGKLQKADSSIIHSRRGKNMIRSHTKSGSTDIKGALYQIRLVLHFMTRAILNGYHSFAVACNMDAAGKFDHVVLRYKGNEHDQEKWIFVRAKNRAAINSMELLDSSKDYDLNLCEYFCFYRQIVGREDAKFKNIKLEELILLTEGNLDDIVAKLKEKLTFEERQHHQGEMLVFAESKRYKIVAADETMQEIIEKFEWPQQVASLDELKKYLDTLTLVVNQPNQDQLTDLIRQDIHLIVPFADKCCAEIYRCLDDKATEWFSESEHGTWLTEETALLWMREASDQDSSLVDPLINKIGRLAWLNLKDVAREHLLSKTVEFQGDEMAVKDLLAPETIEEFMNSKMICLLTKDQRVKIGSWVTDASGYDPRYYIPREIHWPSLRSADERSEDEDKHVQLCYINDEFEKLNGNAVLVEQKTKIILAFKGSLDVIKKCTDVTLPMRFSEEDPIEKVGRFAIISDAVRMNKSFTLTNISRKLKRARPSTWVLRFDLNDPKVTNILKRIELEEIDDAITFIQQLADLSNDLEKIFFRFYLDGNGDMAILLDGFHDISDRNQQKIFQLMTQLKKNEFQLRRLQVWVSLMPHATSVYETATGVLALSLHPFTPCDQEQFLVAYWSSSNRNQSQSEEELHLKAKSLIRLMKDSIRDSEQKFVGIPLLCRMLVEAFDGEINLPDHFDLVGLYGQFWKRKIEMYLIEKCHNDPANSSYSTVRRNEESVAKRSLQKLSLKLLFPEDDVICSNLSNEDICTDWGLTIGSNVFIHETFADYFAALCFIENIENPIISDPFIRTVFIEEEYRVTRSFLNNLLAVNSCTMLLSQNHLSDFGKAILCASEEGNENILVFICQSFKQTNSATNDKNTISLSSVFISDNQRNTPLHLALRNNHEKIIDFIFNFASEIELDILSQNKYGNSLLHLASLNGHTKYVEKILKLSMEKKIDWNILFVKNRDSDTPLHFASRNGHEKIVSTFLKFLTENNLGWDFLFFVNHNADTALHLASRSAHEKVVEIILNFATQKKIDWKMLFAGNRIGDTPIRLASVNGHEKVVELILKFATEKQIDWNILLARNKHGDTPVHLASMFGHDKVIQLIMRIALENNIDWNILFARNFRGDTPLHSASNYGCDQVVDLILKFAFNNKIDWKTLFDGNKNGDTPFHCALWNGHGKVVESVVRLAIEKNADCDKLFAGNKNGNNALHWASKKGQEKVVELILKFANLKKIDWNVVFGRNDRGETALHFASSEGMNEAVKIFLRFGTEKNFNILFAGDENGDTPLHLAADRGHEEIVKLFLEFAHLNEIDRHILLAENKDGDTPLHVAADRGHVKILELIQTFSNLGNQIEF